MLAAVRIPARSQAASRRIARNASPKRSVFSGPMPAHPLELVEAVRAARSAIRASVALVQFRYFAEPVRAAGERHLRGLQPVEEPRRRAGRRACSRAGCTGGGASPVRTSRNFGAEALELDRADAGDPGAARRGVAAARVAISISVRSGKIDVGRDALRRRPAPAASPSARRAAPRPPRRPAPAARRAPRPRAAARGRCRRGARGSPRRAAAAARPRSGAARRGGSGSGRTRSRPISWRKIACHSAFERSCADAEGRQPLVAARAAPSRCARRAGWRSGARRRSSRRS